MKFERSKAWWIAKARQEGDAVIGAGLLALDPAAEARAGERTADVRGETRIDFGRFVNLMRRKLGRTLEEMADAADVDASELLIIEENGDYVPAPRTIYKLAQIFRIPQPRLMQLAGLAVANDDHLRTEAVRFAARSESVQKLTPEEIAALEAFVAVLSEMGSNPTK